MNGTFLFNLLPYRSTATGLSRYVERLLDDWTAATGQPMPQQLRITETGEAVLSRQTQMPKTQLSKLMRWSQRNAIAQHLVPTTKLIEQVKPSLIYSPYTDVLNTRKKYRQVITCHDLTPLYFPNSRKAYWYSRLWQQVQLHRASHVIAISKSVANQLIDSGLSASKITIVPNGIEEVANPVSKPNSVDCLILARHARNKNISLTLKGFANFLRLNRSWDGKIIVVGLEDRCTQDLHRLESDLDLAERIAWRTHVPQNELDFLIKSSFCLISSSLMEGFDYPLLEAQARGIPTLASSIPVHKELHEHTSLFFELGDQGKSLGIQLNRLANEPKLWEQLSLAGLKQAKKYSIKKQIRGISALLENQVCQGIKL